MEKPTLGSGPLNVRKSEICRLCMNTQEYYLNVFVSSEEFKTSISKAIEDLLVLKVAKDDNLPKMVCCPCVTKLMEFREFKEMCVNSAREFARHAPVEPITCPVKDEFLPLQSLGEGTSGTWSNSVDGESQVPMASNDLSLDPFPLQNQTDTKEVYPGDPFEVSDHCGDEDLAETESNGDAAVCHESKHLLMGNQCPVEAERMPVRSMDGGEGANVEKKSRNQNEACDPLALDNPTDTKEVYHRDPLAESDDCGEEDFAGTKCSEDAALCNESKQFLMDDQGEVKKELELTEVASNVESHSRENIDEGDSSDTGGPILLSDILAVMDMVDRFNKIGCLPMEREKESDKLGDDRQGISQKKILYDPSCDPVHKENLQLEHSMVNSFVVNCFSEERVTNQNYVEFYDSRKNISQLNDRARPVRNHERKQLCNQAENAGNPTEYYACNYCSAGYLEKKSLALHIKRHVEGRRSASVLPNNIPPRFSQCLLVKDRGRVEQVIHETSNISLTPNTCGFLPPFKCIECGKMFSTRSNLNRHSVVHAGVKRFKCNECGKMFSQKGHLKRHSVFHTGVKQFKCNECGKVFTRRDHLKRHSVFHTGVKLFKCHECGKMFTRRSHLRTHSVVHTGVKHFKCNGCGKMFATKSDLKKHSVVHTGVKPFKCIECGKVFTRSGNLKTHSLTHSDVKRFKCNECGKMFTRKGHLKRHSVFHTGVKQFKCNECGKVFTRRDHLNEHSVFHTGVKPFKCHECGKMFTRRSCLRTHSVVHTGVKHFKCNVCGKMFSQKGHLRRHSVVHTGVKQFKCNECGKVFTRSDHLNEHSVVHTGVKPFKCNECGKMFTRRSLLRTHSVVHTGVKLFKCNECGKMFSHQSNLRTHSRIHSGVNPL